MVKNNDRLRKIRSGAELKIVFTWRHGGHIDVKNNEWGYGWCTKKLLYGTELFSHLKILLFQKICIATDYVSENDP